MNRSEFLKRWYPIFEGNECLTAVEDGAVFALSESRDRTGFRWNCWIGSGANGYHACRVADATCARSVHHAPIVSADCAYIFLIAQR